MKKLLYFMLLGVFVFVGCSEEEVSSDTSQDFAFLIEKWGRAERGQLPGPEVILKYFFVHSSRRL